MGRKQDKQFNRSAFLNGLSADFYQTRLQEIALSMFEWKNLPSEIDPRYLELTLFNKGAICFFKDEAMGFVALPFVFTSNLDIYGNPIDYSAYGVNGYTMPLNCENSVIIYNNYLRTGCAEYVNMFALKLYNIDRTIDVNINAQKHPIVIQCKDTQRLTMLNLFKEYQGDVPLICATSDIDMNQIKVLDLKAPMVAPELIQIKAQIFNEALTYLGIPNVSVNKKERLITDEVNRTQGGTIASKRSRLAMRQNACKAINEMFGLDIWCEFNTECVNEDETEGKEDEQVYN